DEGDRVEEGQQEHGVGRDGIQQGEQAGHGGALPGTSRRSVAPTARGRHGKLVPGGRVQGAGVGTVVPVGDGQPTMGRLYGSTGLRVYGRVRTMASARLWTPSLRYRLETWLRTVFSAMPSAQAICALLRPSHSNARAARSRAVRPWADRSESCRARPVNSSTASWNSRQAGSCSSSTWLRECNSM